MKVCAGNSCTMQARSVMTSAWSGRRSAAASISLKHPPLFNLQRPGRPQVQVKVFDKIGEFFKGNKSSQDASSSQSGTSTGSFEEEAATMRRIDDTNSNTGVDGGEQAFGPATILLVGYSSEEVEAFRSMMLSMEADMFKISPCSKAMLNGTLQQALEADCPAYEQPALGTRRVVILSGMYSGEVVEVVSAYNDAGLPPAVFAAAVPNNMSRDLKGLLQEVCSEDAVMKRMAAERLAQQQEGGSCEL